MKQGSTNVFGAFEAKTKVTFMFLVAKRQGERYDQLFQQLQTKKQAVTGVFRG